MKQTIPIAAFVRRHWDGCRYWSRDKLVRWVKWFVDHERAYVVTNAGKIKGVAFVRYVSSKEEAENGFVDSDGPVAFVDLTVANDPRAMKALFSLMYAIKGHTKKLIAWTRQKYSDRITIREMDIAKRQLSLSHG